MIDTGDTIALRPKGMVMYLSHLNRGKMNFIGAAKENLDEFCRFKVTIKNNKILLQALDGKYLSRNTVSTNSGEVLNLILPSHITPDANCEFTVKEFDGDVALQANNGKYLAISHRGGQRLLEAKHDGISPFTLFEAQKLR